MGPTPLVSCCIIARNEAAMLPLCLASLQGVADEVIVVDTGSDDGTPELAAAAGARVFHQPWQDDFSAPRNLAAAHATGRWILLLDADERVADRGKPALRAALAADDFDCGLLPLINANTLDAAIDDVVDGTAALGGPMLLPRLFRNTDDLHWEGAIHERPTAWLLRGPKRLCPIADAPLAHYGSVPELRRERGKADRNLRLLEQQRTANPDDPRILDYLAYARFAAGDREGAALGAAAAWQALTRQAQAGGPREAVVTIATLHANFLRESGDLDATLAVIDQALAWCRSSLDADHPNLTYQLGACCETVALRTADAGVRAEYLSRAADAYERCQAGAGRLYPTALNPPGCTDLLAGQRLGTVALMASDGARAEAAWRPIADDRPDDGAARLGLAEARLLQGDAPACLRAVESMLTAAAPDPVTLAALGCHAAGDDRAARAFAAEALQRAGTQGFLAEHRRTRLLALCRTLDASTPVGSR